MLTKGYINDALNKFAKGVIQQSRTNLTKGGKNVSRKLYNSLSYDLNNTDKSFSLSISMEEYGAYQDQGVQGAVNNQKAPNSPFRFGSGTGKKGGLSEGILKWVQAKRFQFRDKNTGKFYSYDQTARLITRSVFQKGIKPSLFFTKPFENAFAKLPEDLVQAFELEMEDLLNFTK